MGAIPEGVETVTGEGADLRKAVIEAADALGVDTKEIGYQLDASHFRTQTGSSTSKRTVKVIAWVKPDAGGKDEAPKAPKPSRRKEEAPKAREPEQDATDEDDDTDDDTDDGAETEASTFAADWFRTLLEHMDIDGTVSASGSDGRVRLVVKADKAGRIVGRRGATLAAIRHLLGLALEKYGDLTVDVDIPDDRKKSRGKGRSDRDDRDDRDDRGRGRSRGRDRDRDRDRRGGGGGGGGGGGQYPEDKLRAVAQRAAEKALETGRPVTINLVLNSYDRHIVHSTANELEGVSTESIVKDGKKYVQVSSDQGAEDDD